MQRFRTERAARESPSSQGQRIVHDVPDPALRRQPSAANQRSQRTERTQLSQRSQRNQRSQQRADYAPNELDSDISVELPRHETHVRHTQQ